MLTKTYNKGVLSGFKTIAFYYVGCLCSSRYKMGAVCSSLYPQMRIFQLLTRFRCIKFSFLLEGIFLSPIVLITRDALKGHTVSKNGSISFFFFLPRSYKSVH